MVWVAKIFLQNRVRNKCANTDLYISFLKKVNHVIYDAVGLIRFLGLQNVAQNSAAVLVLPGLIWKLFGSFWKAIEEASPGLPENKSCSRPNVWKRFQETFSALLLTLVG